MKLRIPIKVVEEDQAKPRHGQPWSIFRLTVSLSPAFPFPHGDATTASGFFRGKLEAIVRRSAPDSGCTSVYISFRAGFSPTAPDPPAEQQGSAGDFSGPHRTGQQFSGDHRGESGRTLRRLAQYGIWHPESAGSAIDYHS